MKDRFSFQSDRYKKFRPGYPSELFHFIQAIATSHQRVLDIGTGNGQLALPLADFFDRVDATDISTAQMQHAPRHERIHYQMAQAHQQPFENHCFDVITVGQAVHWFPFTAFYTEVKRLLKPNGKLVLTGYNLLSIDPEIDAHVRYLHDVLLSQYWDPERAYVDSNYRTLPFEMEEVSDLPKLSYEVDWNYDQFMGYIQTWSAIKKLESSSGESWRYDFEKVIRPLWKEDEFKRLSFPTILRVGK